MEAKTFKRLLRLVKNGVNITNASAVLGLPRRSVYQSCNDSQLRMLQYAKALHRKTYFEEYADTRFLGSTHYEVMESTLIL